MSTRLHPPSPARTWNPHLRLCLLRLLRLALSVRSSPLTLDSGPILVVAPHPDDETLGCGGLILRARQKQQSVSVLFLTDGAASHPGHPTLTPQALASQRRSEAREAASLLGLADTDVAFLDLPDGTLPHLSQTARVAAIQAIAAQLQLLRPATICAAYRSDGSSEHEAAFQLLSAALHFTVLKPRLLEYFVWTAFSPRLLARVLKRPGRLHRALHPKLGPVKSRALASYRSQFRPVPPWPAPVQPLEFANAFSHESEFFIELSMS